MNAQTFLSADLFPDVSQIINIYTHRITTRVKVWSMSTSLKRSLLFLQLPCSTFCPAHWSGSHHCMWVHTCPQVSFIWSLTALLLCVQFLSLCTVCGLPVYVCEGPRGSPWSLARVPAAAEGEAEGTSSDWYCSPPIQNTSSGERLSEPGSGPHGTFSCLPCGCDCTQGGFLCQPDGH